MNDDFPSLKIARRILIDHFPDPSPTEFRDEIVRASREIQNNLKQLAASEIESIEVEFTNALAEDIPTNFAIRTKDLQTYVFSVYYMLLVQDFAHTIALDSAIRAAISDAFKLLRLDRDQVLTYGRNATQLHTA